MESDHTCHRLSLFALGHVIPTPPITSPSSVLSFLDIQDTLHSLPWKHGLGAPPGTNVPLSPSRPVLSTSEALTDPNSPRTRERDPSSFMTFHPVAPAGRASPDPRGWSVVITTIPAGDVPNFHRRKRTAGHTTRSRETSGSYPGPAARAGLCFPPRAGQGGPGLQGPDTPIRTP